MIIFIMVAGQGMRMKGTDVPKALLNLPVWGSLEDKLYTFDSGDGRFIATHETVLSRVLGQINYWHYLSNRKDQLAIYLIAGYKEEMFLPYIKEVKEYETIAIKEGKVKFGLISITTFPGWKGEIRAICSSIKDLVTSNLFGMRSSDDMAFVLGDVVWSFKALCEFLNHETTLTLYSDSINHGGEIFGLKIKREAMQSFVIEEFTDTLFCYTSGPLNRKDPLHIMIKGVRSSAREIRDSKLHTMAWHFQKKHGIDKIVANHPVDDIDNDEQYQKAIKRIGAGYYD